MARPERVILEEGPAAGTLQHTAVSHVGFRVPEPEHTADFYGRVLGLVIHEQLPDGGLRLGWGAGHHVMDLLPGERRIDHYAFEVREQDGIAGIAERLRAAGRTVEELDPSYIDGAVGDPEGIVTTDPQGIKLHFHTAVHRQGESAADTGRRPIKYQHITMGVASAQEFVSFFTGVVGFRVSDQLNDGGFVWLRSDRDHHTLAAVENGFPGDIDHYSYDLAEWEDFKAWCDRLTDLEVPVAWGPGRHGPGNNLFVFFDDPAGNHVELSAEMEKFHDDRVTYVPRTWIPQPTTVNLWGGQKPNWRRVGEKH